MMRVTMIAAAAMLAACSAPTPAGAQAESGGHAGTWAFQTEPYGNEQFGVVMSGVAVMTPAAPDRYDIRLLANELIIERVSGQSRLLTARETCAGEVDGGQFTITCQMAEPLEGYEPDNFILQRGEQDQLVGVLNSATSGQVTFTRLR
jgi:hypothetical protein